MEFVVKAYSQLADLVRSMTPAARLTTIALLATVGISAGFLFRYANPIPDDFLFGGRPLADREIARLEAAFSKAGLNEWETSGNRIRVPRSKRFNYIAAAADENSLPDDFDSILESTIKASSPFEPKELRDMRMRFALQMEVAQVISAMKGIDRATVKFNEERAGGFQRGTKKTAMVAASAEGNDLLTREQVESIRRTVAMTFGVAPEFVVVNDLHGPSYPGSGPNGAPTSEDNIYAANKRMFETYYQDKIANSLTMIPGVVVGVNVELDTRLNQTTQTTTFNQPQTVRSSSTNSKNTSRADDPGGRAGAVPNGGLGNRAEEVAAAPSASGSESTSSETSEDSESVVGREVTDIVQAGLTPTNVTATIQVPRSYYLTIWRERNPPKDGQPVAEPDTAELARLETEESERIKESVQNLIPRLAMGKDPYPRVYVGTFVDTKLPDPAPPSLAARAVGWMTENWRTLALFAMAAFGVVMLRSFVRTAPAASERVPDALAAALDRPDEGNASHRASGPTDGSNAAAEPGRARTSGEPQPAPAGLQASSLLKRKSSRSGPSLRDELAELVREDPEAAATILSNWIGDAM
ncbi:MAG: hypothetical protein FJ297_03130 [Planctomycetes bacterium]|nr:hypothetical protein [Planctomycetota bacterium]